ncbi:MAG: hypothetical protein RIB47_06355 [Cyclobacteriaceae bacterium]
MKRKVFLKRAIGGVVGGISGLYVLSGCSSSEDVAPAPSCVDKGAKPLSISSNHGHTLSIPKEDVVSGTAKSYNIFGSATHGHSVTLEPADFAKLQNGEQVQVVSTNDNAHTHNITVVCNA